VNLTPSDTDRELAAAVRDYTQGLGERVAVGEREGTLPLDVVRELGALGVLGMTVPERDGGLGASAVAFTLVLEELAADFPSLPVLMLTVKSASEDRIRGWKAGAAAT